MRWFLVFLLFSLPAQARDASEIYVVRHDRWSDADEQGWRDFIAAIGQSDCRTLDFCLHGKANRSPAAIGPGSCSSPTAPTCLTCCVSIMRGSAACPFPS
ncbi:MAG TPA: hypothetical protein VHZ29_08975 [Rhizomicrobium sp.]|nr:hypothetical protein [Rhizomicrobium sp.]